MPNDPSDMNNELHNENTIRILISSDPHVGYGEKDPVRGNDSFVSFNEILEIARERDVGII